MCVVYPTNAALQRPLLLITEQLSQGHLINMGQPYYILPFPAAFSDTAAGNLIGFYFSQVVAH